jgi:hypothetical protein
MAASERARTGGDSVVLGSNAGAVGPTFKTSIFLYSASLGLGGVCSCLRLSESKNTTIYFYPECIELKVLNCNGGLSGRLPRHRRPPFRSPFRSRRRVCHARHGTPQALPPRRAVYGAFKESA